MERIIALHQGSSVYVKFIFACTKISSNLVMSHCSRGNPLNFKEGMRTVYSLKKTFINCFQRSTNSRVYRFIAVKKQLCEKFIS